MSILDLQMRHRELGRLRLGTKGPKGNPMSLNTWRLTSPDKTLIDAAADVWGGETEPWGASQYEVITEISRIPVRVPAQHPDPEYQLWSAAGLKRRCNGAVAYVANGGEAMVEQPCICAQSDERECKPHTRFEFVLPDLPDIGVWVLTSTGYNAAAELANSVRMLAGSAVEANLAIEHREVKRPGQPAHRFTVAVLQTTVSLRSLLEGGGVPSLGSGSVSAPAHALPSSASVGADPPSPDPEMEGGSSFRFTGEVVGEDGSVPHAVSEGERFEDIRRRAEEQAWTSLLVEIESEPDDSETMDDIEIAVRSLFRRMETVGLWPESERALHAALEKHHGAKHVRDLRKAELVAFAGRVWAAARERIANED